MREITKSLAAAGLLGLLAVATATAADIEAGKETAAVCAACHGENGISVSDDIPNLAGQKAKYLTAQLKAFHSGKRQNPIMNPIAEQLGEAEIENVAAFFANLPGGAGASAVFPELAADKMAFPEGYRESFTHYTTISFPKRKQVRHFYANDAAMAAAKAGIPFPNGAVFLVEILSAKLDAEGKLIEGADGHLETDELTLYTAMEKQAGWGDAVPEMLRSGDWSYAVFTTDKTHRPNTNEAKCLACHKPFADKDYVLSLEALQAAATMPQ